MSKVIFLLLAIGFSPFGSVRQTTTPQTKPGQTSPGALQPPSPNIDKADQLLDTAQFYVELNDYVNAQKTILEAITTAPGSIQIRERATSLWQGIRVEVDKSEKAEKERTKNQFLAQLAEAERLSQQGKIEKASEIAMAVLKQTNDPDLVARSNRLLEQNRPKVSNVLGVVPERFLVIGGWAVDVVLAIVLIIIVYVLLLLLRSLWSYWTRYYKVGFLRRVWSDWAPGDPQYSLGKSLADARRAHARWAVKPIDDTTKLGLAEALTTCMSRWGQERAPASAGLLKLGAIQLPSAPQLEQSGVQFDLAPALEGISLQIGTVNIGGVAKFLSALKNWTGAKRLWITGSASLVESRVLLRLTRRNANGTSETVTAEADKTNSEGAAETASYKMYYLIAKESPLSEADAADELRNGLKLLGQYLDGGEHKQLEDAFEVIRKVRSQAPGLSEAYLYEGIALDLLERHDQAIKRFQYVAQHTSDANLKQKANYNEAVSLFRKYTPEAFNEAIVKLDALTVLPANWDANDESLRAGLEALANSPLKSLALAAKANAIAHQPIFWRNYKEVPKGADDETVKNAKIVKKPELDNYLAEVKRISQCLRDVLLKAQDSKLWDIFTLKQLEWAIENANGNIYLNYAKSFLIPPYVPNAGKELHDQYIRLAYDAFQSCEMLLPAGVETLTNLATVLLALERREDSRDYLQRAIKLNPDYEYTYLRIAQSWEEDGRIDEVTKVLRDFVREREPAIPSFKELYKKYAIELAKQSIQAATEQPEPAQPAPIQPATATPTSKPAAS